MQQDEGQNTTLALLQAASFQRAISNMQSNVNRFNFNRNSKSSLKADTFLNYTDRYEKVTNQQLPIDLKVVLQQLDKRILLNYKQNSISQSPLQMNDSKDSSRKFLNRSYIKQKHSKKKNSFFKILNLSNQLHRKNQNQYGLIVQKIQPVTCDVRSWALFNSNKTHQRQLPFYEDTLKIINPSTSRSRRMNNSSSQKGKSLSDSFRLTKIQNLSLQRTIQVKEKNFNYAYEYFCRQSLLNNVLILPQSQQTLRIKALFQKGNNSQLVKQILQKRWWWKITDNVEDDVQFLWTQKKNLKFHLKQQILLEQQPIKQTGQINIQIQEYLKQKVIYCKVRGVQIIADQNYVNCHNHLEGNHFLGNKKFLYRNMKKYYSSKKENVFDHLPLTFHLSSLECQDYNDFLKEKEGPWIVKPGENSNRGQGIKIFSSVEQVGKFAEANLISGERSWIIQKYLVNTLLYKGRKLDVRCYMLVTCHNRKLKGYWYEDGYVRTSSQKWKLDQLDNHLIHLTNDAIQKQDEDYGRFEPANKLSLSELSVSIDKFCLKDVSAQLEVAMIIIIIQKLARETLEACYPILDSSRKAHNFEIFGFDFMIDEHHKAWLIEVNTNPCLETPCSLLARIIPQMIDNAFKIGLDPLFPPPLTATQLKINQIIDNYDSQNKFKLIFDEEKTTTADFFL